MLGDGHDFAFWLVVTKSLSACHFISQVIGVTMVSLDCFISLSKQLHHAYSGILTTSELWLQTAPVHSCAGWKKGIRPHLRSDPVPWDILSESGWWWNLCEQIEKPWNRSWYQGMLQSISTRECWENTVCFPHIWHCHTISSAWIRRSFPSHSSAAW